MADRKIQRLGTGLKLQRWHSNLHAPTISKVQSSWMHRERSLSLHVSAAADDRTCFCPPIENVGARRARNVSFERSPALASRLNELTTHSTCNGKE